MGDDNTSVTTDEMVTATSPAEEFPNEPSTKLQGVDSEPVADQVLPSTNGTDSSTNDSEVSEEVRQQVPVQQQDLQPETTEAVTNPPEERTTVQEPVVGGAETSPVVAESAVEHTAELQLEPVAEAVVEPASESTVEPVAEAESEVVAEPESEAVAEPESETVAEPESETVAEPESETVAEPLFEPVFNREPEAVPTSYKSSFEYRCGVGTPAEAVFKRRIEPVRGYELPTEPIRGYELPSEPIRGYELPVEPIRGYERPSASIRYELPPELVRGYKAPIEVRGYELPAEPEPEPRFEPQAEPQPKFEPQAEPEPRVEPQAEPEPEPEPTVVTPTITETTVVTPTVTEVAVAAPVPEPHVIAHQFVEDQPKVEPAEEVVTEISSPAVVPAVADPVPTATTTTISTEFVAKEEPAVTEPVNVESIPVVADLPKEDPTEFISAAPAIVSTAMAPEPAIETGSTMIPSVVAAAVPQPVVVATSTTPIAVVAPTVKVVESKPTPAIITNPLPVSVVPVITSTKQNGTSATQPTAVKTTPKPKPKNNSKPNNTPVAVTTPSTTTTTTTPKKKSKKKQPEPEPVVDDVKKRRKTWTPEEQKYACKLCNFRSAYASSLGRHVQMSHKDNLSTKDESSCGSSSSSTPAPAVTPSPTPTPTPTPTPQPAVAPVATPISMTTAASTAILTIPKTEMPTTTTIVQQQQPKPEEVNFRHVQILQPQQQLLTYEYHPVVSSTYQDVVNNPPIYNTSVRYDTADGIPITLIDPSTHNVNFGESEYMQYHKTEEDMGTIRSDPTVLNTLGSMAVPVSDIINLPPQSTMLTPLTSADNTIDSVASGLTPDARKRPLVTAVKSKPQDVVAKKRKTEGDGPSFSNVLMSTPTPPTAPSNQTGSTPTPKKKKKKNPAGNNQGGTGNNATPVKTAPPSFANASTPSTKGKTDKNGEDTPGKKKKAKKPSDKPSNPCLITSTSSSCPVCSFSTKYQFNLARHFQATHKEELQKVLNGTVSYPGIRKREMKEKSTKPKPKSKEKKPKQPPANDQSSQSSQYSSSQNNSSQLSVAQEFEQFVRDENLEMFAEADNLDLSEPMVSSFIESLFSADMGAAEGWNNVGNHQVVLNPSVHPQTIATTAYIQHPVQPGTQMQAVSQGGYVTTVDLLQHQTQGQVVGGYITQPQQLYEFQKAPHSNPIQANVVINGVTTTMDLNSVIEKNTSQLHVQQPENPSHQSQSKVFIAQSSESHTSATAGALDLNSSQHFQGQQQNGFTGHLSQHLASTDHLAKWTSQQQQQQQVIISSSVQNQQPQWSQSQVYTQQSQQYASSSNPPPATVQYHTPAGTIINHPIEAPPFAQWQSQPQQVHQNHPIQSTIQISAESRPLTTVDTSFLHSALSDNSHHLSSSQLVGSVSGAPAPPPLVTVSNTNSNATVAPATGNTPVKRPSPKKKKKAAVPPPAPAPVTTPTSGKKKTDVDAMSPEEREKRERYLQKRRERWKVSQERKKQLKNAQNVEGGSSASDSNSVASSVPVNQQNHQLPPHSLVSSPLLTLESPAFLRLDESFLSLPPNRPVCTVTSSLRSPIFSLPSINSIATSPGKLEFSPSIPTHVVEQPDASCESPIKQLTLSAVLDLADRSTKQKKQVTFSSAVPKSSKEARREYMRIYNKNRPPRNQSKKRKIPTKVDSSSKSVDMPPKKRGKNPPKREMASSSVQSSQPMPIAALSVSSTVTRSGTGKIQKPKSRIGGGASVLSRPAIKQEDVKPASRSKQTPVNKLFLDKTAEQIQAFKKERQAQLAKERHEELERRRRSLMDPVEIACVSAPGIRTLTDEKPAIGKGMSVKVETAKVENQELVVAIPASTSLEELEADRASSESGILDVQLPHVAQNCNFSGCTFVANNVFELEFHENIHRTAESLPPLLAQLLEASGKLPEALSLRPCINPLFDTTGAAVAIPQVKYDNGNETRRSLPST